MATAPSARVAQQMGNLFREITTAGPKAINAAAAAAKTIHLAEIRRASGGDLRLSGVGAKGAPVNVRYQAIASSQDAAAMVRAVGPLHLLERPIKPHVILPRSRRGRVGVLATPYGPRRRVQHPGVSSPRRPWAIGFVRAKPAITKIIQRQYGSAFARGVR